jgi:hypothetical protein
MWLQFAPPSPTPALVAVLPAATSCCSLLMRPCQMRMGSPARQGGPTTGEGRGRRGASRAARRAPHQAGQHDASSRVHQHRCRCGCHRQVGCREERGGAVAVVATGGRGPPWDEELGVVALMVCDPRRRPGGGRTQAEDAVRCGEVTRMTRQGWLEPGQD